jgi:arylsulfatase
VEKFYFNRKYIVWILVFLVIGLTTFMVSFRDSDDKFSIDSDIYRNSTKDEISVESVVRIIPGYSGKRPNIVFILCDDMGYADLGSYGSKAIMTPNIDELAKQGVRFTDFYSSNGLCSPSRAGFLTGRYPHRTGVTFPIWPKDDSLMRRASRVVAGLFAAVGALDLPDGESLNDGLPASEITIAEALKLSGYTTAAIGKWHLGDFTKQPEYHTSRHGFDYFVGFNASNDDWPAAFWRDETELLKDIELDQERYTGLFTNDAIEFIERSKDKPFFVYLSHKDPHQPCFPSKKFKGKSKGGPHGDAVQEVEIL